MRTLSLQLLMVVFVVGNGLPLDCDPRLRPRLWYYGTVCYSYVLVCAKADTTTTSAPISLVLPRDGNSHQIQASTASNDDDTRKPMSLFLRSDYMNKGIIVGISLGALDALFFVLLFAFLIYRSAGLSPKLTPQIHQKPKGKTERPRVAARSRA